MDISDRLRILRAISRESQETAAAESNICTGTLQKLESGLARNPSARILMGLAEHYRVTVGYLLDGDEKDDHKAK